MERKGHELLHPVENNLGAGQEPSGVRPPGVRAWQEELPLSLQRGRGTRVLPLPGAAKHSTAQGEAGLVKPMYYPSWDT